MASKLAEVFVDITGNPAPLHKTLDGVKASLMGFASNAGLAIAAGIGAAATATAYGLYKAVQAASDLNESLSKLDAIFGPTGKAIADQAEVMAKKFGVIKREWVDNAVGIANMGMAAGQTKEKAVAMGNAFAELGLDLMSQDNLTFAESLEKIRSGLAGEAEPLRKYGVLLSEDAVKQLAYAEGIARAGKELTEAQKIEARAILIKRQLARVEGDQERTSGALASRQRKLIGDFTNLSATIGNQIMPAFEALLGIAEKSLSGISAFVEANGDEIREWAVIARGAIEGVGMMFQGLAALVQGALAPVIAAGTHLINVLTQIGELTRDVLGIAPGMAAAADAGAGAGKAIGDIEKKKIEAAAAGGMGAAAGGGAAGGGGGGHAKHSGLVEYAKHLQEGIFGKDQTPQKQLDVAKQQLDVQKKLEALLRHPAGAVPAVAVF